MNEVPSPCVSICALDVNDVCVGCHRTGDEISRWWGMDNTEKKKILELAKEREQKSYI
ncbi:Fe-S oxidoreductase [Oleiphilus sp. HI0081]|nr:Fe-S oxidoreductase [Oleiphilus sp. HI0043]KZY49699.1 Fe-S oxidoreductase [Oleiphilus sp. HI0050]KZY56842.1 Fe-S oxidoreductase [Oleiphilus sp. HI0061]KZY72811.1 Fe-S oxidoreductase [Oleiphilus sp. HI0068]KZY77363.1 Fe-S oxidoreductase [Oleiphilus sp. HI0069]KZY86157.1 Fe-S oxidoreductase [Oleiphilus sp. HI0072]KZZ21843.1 Fe-S oxidoreductase [Oleiphilus sp. HI0078]KZZ29929.1 Fe-S oxidoreductase [Oleiphilus sp. HI0081]KZZ32110.1 Fe-S oxidoreductase [Oleiphilus sp. HI0086]KZZ33040.1 Fe-S 